MQLESTPPAATSPGPESPVPERVVTAVSNPIRIVLADDHPVVREGLRMLISTQPDLEIVGVANDGDEAFKAALQLKPDVIVLDLLMPGVTGLESARQIKKGRPEAKIVGLSASDDVGLITEFIASGAEGFVLKRAAADELVTAIRVVQRGGVHVDPRVQTESPSTALTKRDNAVIRLVARGYSNKEIASLLDLSVKTIENYKARAMEKAGLRNRVEIVRHGAQRGWLTGWDKTG